MTTAVMKIELCVIDFDGLGVDDVKSVLENTKYPNYCISPSVKAIDVRFVEWEDSHPLNQSSTCDQAFRELFSKGETR